MRSTAFQGDSFPVKELLNPGFVEQFLHECPAIRWPNSARPRHTRIERLWPVEADCLGVEWSFDLGTHGRCSLFATPTRPMDTMGSDVCDLFHSSGVLQGLRLTLNPWRLQVHTPDQDPSLSQMPACLDRPTCIRDAIRTLGTSDALRRPSGPTDVRLLSYRARRRAAFRFRLSSPPDTIVSGKTFRDARGERLLRCHASFGEHIKRTSAGEFSVAEPIGYVPDLRLALFGWCGDDATRSRRRCVSSAGPSAIKALAHLHRAPADGIPLFVPDDELAILQRWRSAVAVVDSGVARVMDDLVQSLQVVGPPDGAAAATIHRDFYGRQVLSNNGQVTLLDLDTVSRGDPAVDVGNFLAHLWLDAVKHDCGDTLQFATGAQRVVADYREAGGRLTRDSLRWYWASALIRLGAVHVFRTDTARCSEALWQQASELLDGSGMDSRLPRRQRSETAALSGTAPILAEVKA